MVVRHGNNVASGTIKDSRNGRPSERHRGGNLINAAPTLQRKASDTNSPNGAGIEH